MNAVLWIFIALAFGLLLFTGLQDQLPEELSFLRSSGDNTIVQGDTGTARASFTYQGWRVRQEGANVELVHKFSGELEANGRSYDAPEVGFLCREGKLDARIDTRAATTGTTNTPVTVSLGGGKQMWAKGTGMNVFPPSPRDFALAASKALKPVEVTFSYAELGNQTVKLDPAGLASLLSQLPGGCKIP